MKRFILSTFLSLLTLGASAFTTNTFTSVDTAQVWAESAGPLKLFSLSAANSEGADRYLMLFATDSSANGDYPIRAWRLTNSATLNLNFFPDGYYVKSVTSAQVEKHGCTFWVSTTATTLTKSTGGGVTMTSVKMAQSDVQPILPTDSIVYVGPGSGTTAGIQEALNARTNVFLAPGVYVVSNSIVLYPGMRLTGSGTNTQIRWYGRQNADSTITGNDWCCFNIRTNTFISDMDINCMVRGVNIYSACIGNATGIEVVGASNVRIERVSMHGDTDNFFVDVNRTFDNITLLDCVFDSPWDTFACSGIGDCNFTLINPTIRNTGTIQNLSGVKSPPNAIATSLRLSSSAGVCVINVYGGTIDSVDINGSINTGTLNFYGTQFTARGTNFLLGINSGITINALTCSGISLSGVLPQAGGARITARINIQNTPMSFDEESVDTFHLIDGNVSTLYFATNTSYAQREFNGVNWHPVGFDYYTNKLEVTGATTVAYNGIYTFKASQVSSTVNYVWTNLNAKFLIVTTNIDLPDYALAAISDNQSITDGLEYAGTDGPLRKNWSDAGISIRRAMVPPNMTGGFASTLSSATASTAITFPNTTVNWTNTQGFNIVLYINNSGVTVTSISKNGQQIFGSLANDTTLSLKPGDYFSQAYTGTPSARWEPQ